MQKFTSSILKLYKMLYSNNMIWENNYLAGEFLRKTSEVFSAKKMKSFFQTNGIKVSEEMCKNYLEQTPDVFEYEDGEYYSRAGLFTNVMFSIKPSLSEYQNRMVVLGSRCMPFLDPLVYSWTYSVEFDGKELNRVVGNFSSKDAIDIFIGYGNEFCIQLINADPANEKTGNILELTPTVKLSGFDIGFLIDEHDFKYGDVLYFTVKNWDKGILDLGLEHKFAKELSVLNELTGSDKGDLFSRKRMLKTIENNIFESLETIGPVDNIDHQLLFAYCGFFKPISVMDYGNINEIIQNSDRLVIKRFGVESRIWKKDEEIPFIGPWNEIVGVIDKDLNPQMKDYPFVVPQMVIDQFICDMLFDRLDNLEELVSRVFISELGFSDDDRKKLLKMVEERATLIKQEYNWFTDTDYGPARKKTLKIYLNVSIIMHEIEISECDFKDLPQKELSILIQVYRHVLGMINLIREKNISESDMETYFLSIDGMAMTFEDVKWVIKDSLSKLSLKKFKVVK